MQSIKSFKLSFLYLFKAKFHQYGKKLKQNETLSANWRTFLGGFTCDTEDDDSSYAEQKLNSFLLEIHPQLFQKREIGQILKKYVPNFLISLAPILGLSRGDDEIRVKSQDAENLLPTCSGNS